MENVIIADIEKYNDSLEELASGDIVIVSDFDFTFTHGDRRLCKSSSGLTETMKGDFSRFVEDRKKLYQTFQPYEHDPSLKKDERDAWMKQWWDESLGLYKKHSIRRGSLTTIDWSQSPIRDGWKEFLHFCHANKVPVHILSAGIGQTITGILDFHSISTTNITIISNELIFDREGICVGHNPNPPIHTGNKKDHTIHGDEKKIILFGDHIDDAEMTNDATLRVGFYNPGTSASIDEFVQRFDVVIERADSDAGYLRTLARNIKI